MYTFFIISGLIHVSQMSSAHIEDPGEMLSRGEMVYCKVITIDVSFRCLVSSFLQLQLFLSQCYDYSFIVLSICYILL